MRIVTYHPRAAVGDGGITNSVRRLSEAWARAGIDPVIAYDGEGSVQRDAAGVEWVPIPHVGSGWARVPTGLGEVVRSADVVVLNSAWSATNIIVGASARRAGTPYVLAPRGAYDPLILTRRRLEKRIWWVLFERRLVRRAAAVHVFFDEQVRDVASLGYRGRYVIAPNGVMPVDSTWDGGSGGYVLYLGRFDPEHKGLDLLLHAVASLPVDRRPRLRLHGPDWRGGRAVVEALIGRLELASWVAVGDAVYGQAKEQLLIRSSGLVYPSRWEGFGNSLAEAAALGIPTLATPYPLARFLETNGGCIVAEPDPTALADGLDALRGPHAPQVGARAAQIVRDELTWDAVARRWLSQLAAVTDAAHGVR